MSGTEERTTTPPVRRRAADSRINLRSNELIHPEATRVLQRILARLEPEHLRRYPALAEDMEALAGYFGRPVSDCVVTPGSDAAIRLVCESFARRGGRVVLLQAPNYDAWEQAARLRGLEVQAFEAPDACVEPQLTALVAAAERTRGAIIAVSTPNGPVGGVASPEQLDRLAAAAEHGGHWLVLDGCYQAFAGPHDALVPRATARTLVLHSFSKSHGLAGARVALVFGARERLEELDAWPTEQMVGGASMVAARVAIEHHAALSRAWAEIRDVRADAAARLRALGGTPLPSGGNFLTVRVGTASDAARIMQRVAEVGYSIRDLSPLAGLQGCIRFTIGDAATTRVFLEQLGAMLDRGGSG